MHWCAGCSSADGCYDFMHTQKGNHKNARQKGGLRWGLTNAENGLVLR